MLRNAACSGGLSNEQELSVGTSYMGPECGKQQRPWVARLLQQVVGRVFLAGVVPALPFDVQDCPREPRGRLPPLWQEINASVA